MIKLDHIRVSDCMHHGILSCGPDAPLGEVARTMAKNRVHAVAVTNGESSRPVAVVSDRDVVSAAASGRQPLAIAVAATEPLAIGADQPLHRAAQLMMEHEVTHLIVLDTAGGYPIGVLSTLDVATVYAEITNRA